MQPEYYSLPLQLEAIMQKRDAPKCTLQQSVAQQLHLLLTTGFGEYSANEGFGCNIWEHDFTNLTSGYKLKETIRQSLLQTIRENEKRLGQVKVELQVRQEELIEGIGTHRIRKRMDVTITGVLQLTKEKFTYKDTFFIGPLSY
jgi:phage baseplate assembly protein W